MNRHQGGSWFRKFSNAFRGIGISLVSQSSFWVHVPVSVGVGVLGWWLGVSVFEGFVLGLCVGLVMIAEMLNTAIEYLAKEITDEFSENVRDGLDVASGAVLLSAVVAATIGAWILVPRVWAVVSG